ncbi:putative ribonuclease H protein [Sesbania bispinosa]|nr:putative ribonuclease H protein [Sesbania bispinosa]
MALDGSCARCGMGLEDTVHYLRDCVHSRMVWNSCFPFKDHSFYLQGLSVWIKHHVKSVHGHSFMATLWWIWRWRNNLSMAEDKWHVDRVLTNIKASIQDFHLYASGKDIGESFTAYSRAFWLPPPSGVFKVNTDGNFVHSTA